MATRRRSEPPRTTPPAVPPAGTSPAEPTGSPPKSATSTATAPTSGAVRAFGIQSAPERRGATVSVTVNAEMRRGMIAEAAYRRAERRGFLPGSEVDDWLAAEHEVDALLSTAGARQ